MKKALNFLSTLVIITLLISGVLYLGSQGEVSKNPERKSSIQISNY